MNLRTGLYLRSDKEEMKNIYSLLPRAACFILAVVFLSGWMPGLQTGVMADDDDDDEGVSSRLVMFQGRPAVRLEQEMLDKTHVETIRLEEQSLLHEIRTIGEVVDITPLLEARSRYLDLKSEKDQVSASLEVADDTVDRLSTLQSLESNISTRELDAAKLEYKKSKIRLDTLNSHIENSRNIIRQRWGGVLADWAMDSQSARLPVFAINGDEILLLVQSPVSGVPESIYVNSSDERTNARQADFISPAPRALANRRGDTYYYSTKREELRSGMRLYVWVPDPEQEISGYILPRNAIVWYNGRPWFYVREDDNHFVKKQVVEYIVTEQGWLVQDSDFAGLDVVIAGSQLLLSEEYRWQIPDEDDDP